MVDVGKHLLHLCDVTGCAPGESVWVGLFDRLFFSKIMESTSVQQSAMSVGMLYNFKSVDMSLRS